ncbi:hypothetical protein QYE76_063467 [Lolium multiflorum]|uniref:Uncharacterized protein n=1 Tax=Lolium multiflorum TaxID=4521 RepID=A0AAD8W9C2_LOLMU|nr:hypothetical protein QYE76_063467 [Lolium multiflorum]
MPLAAPRRRCSVSHPAPADSHGDSASTHLAGRFPCHGGRSLLVFHGHRLIPPWGASTGRRRCCTPATRTRPAEGISRRRQGDDARLVPAAAFLASSSA